MIARIEIRDGYTLCRNAERLEKLRDILPHIEAPKLDDAGAVHNTWEIGQQLDNLMVDLVDQGPLLLALGFEFTVKAFKSSAFVQMRADLSRLEKQYKLIREKIYDPESNTIVQVHVPNGFLHTVNEVQVVEDSCTDTLQGELDRGWRILAVCPSIDQRRPDYILGRVVPPGEIKRRN